jgi:hypothetical protein
MRLGRGTGFRGVRLLLAALLGAVLRTVSAGCAPFPTAKPGQKVFLEPLEAWVTTGDIAVARSGLCGITKDGLANYTFAKVAVVAETLVVDTSDFTYASAYSVSNWVGNYPSQPPYGVLLSPGSCMGGSAPDAASVLDLHGTGYMFDVSKTKCGPETNPKLGFKVMGSCTFSADHQRLDVTGGRLLWRLRDRPDCSDTSTHARTATTNATTRQSQRHLADSRSTTNANPAGWWRQRGHDWWVGLRCGVRGHRCSHHEDAPQPLGSRGKGRRQRR